MAYYVDTIRRERPQTIQVQRGRKMEEGWLRGWCREFPLVCFGPGHAQEVEVSVETIVHCLNTGQPLSL